MLTVAYPIKRALAPDAEGLLRPVFPESWNRRSQDLAPAYHDAGVFSFSPAAHILDLDLVVTQSALPFALARHKAVDIDEPEDLALAEMIDRGRQTMRTGGRET
jgi:N-acylneuraminate cytidylyltransferase